MNEIIKKIDDLFNEELNYEQTSKNLIDIYYMIGKYLSVNKTQFKYKNIYELEELLRNKYGLIIGFTRRNLMNMVTFYETYKDKNINELNKVSWNKHLLILKQNNKEELLNYCIEYNINKKELEKIIKKGFDIKNISNKYLEEDNMTLEIISLKCSKN